MAQQYKTAADAAARLGVSERTVRNYAEQYDWFGGRLGESGTWVFTDAEIDKMLVTPRPMAGRPRKPIVATSQAPALPDAQPVG